MLYVLLLHSRLAWTVVIYLAAVGLWGLWTFARREPVTPTFVAALIVAEVFITLQVLLGLTMLGLGLRSGTLMHYLYGALAIIALPAAYGVLRENRGFRAAGLYAVVCLITLGLGLRGIMTALGG